MTKYIKVEWPEMQKFQELKNYDEDCYEHESGMITFVPEDLYNEVMYKLEFPKTYENTTLGTIVCYENKAVVNEKDVYWYDWDKLMKKDSEVLVYKCPQWIVTKCKACADGFPILFTNCSLFPGFNCEIIGVKDGL